MWEWTSCLICYILIISVDINFHCKLRGFRFITETISAVSLRLFLRRCNWPITLNVGNTNPWAEHRHSSPSPWRQMDCSQPLPTPITMPFLPRGLYLIRGSSIDQTNSSSLLLHLGRNLVRAIRKYLIHWNFVPIEIDGKLTVNEEFFS